MSRIFLIGMTQNQVDNIRALTDPIYQEIDGLCFVDHGSTDGTRELLEERKGAGKIIERPWLMSHDFSLNHVLLEGGFKDGDYLILRDSVERFNPEWAKKIRNFIDTLDFAGVRTLYNYGKIFAFKYNDSLFFNGSPHFGVEGVQHKMVDLKDYHNEDLHEWTWRIRDGEEGGRPIDNKIDHEARYYFQYGRSNHLLLGREDCIEEYQRLELIRKHVRDQAKLLGFKTDIDGLKDFMRWMTDEEREDQTRLNGLNWINSCSILKNFYRIHLLNHSWDDIISTENSWTLEYE